MQSWSPQPFPNHTLWHRHSVNVDAQIYNYSEKSIRRDIRNARMSVSNYAEKRSTQLLTCQWLECDTD